MRIIAGTYRSRTIAAPAGIATRPTSDRLRERLFNILAPRIRNAHVADLFAGSGAIGIEALSRGAAHVLFAEKDPAALAAIRANLARLGITTGFSIAPTSVITALRQAAQAAKPFDLVLLDPPYEAPPYEQAAGPAETLHLLSQHAASLLTPGSIVVVEHRSSRRGKLPEPVATTYGALHRYRLIEQGEAALSFFHLVQTSPAS